MSYSGTRIGQLLLAATVLTAPVAFGQVADLPCGTPPLPQSGFIPYNDISTEIGYALLAAPTTDTLSDWFGGANNNAACFGQVECYSQSEETEIAGPFAQAFNLATIPLPFPFGFSGIYADGGVFSQPMNVSVWSNGLLTFDPSVSFDPLAFPVDSVPADCQFGQTQYCDYSNGNKCINYSSPNSAAVADTFGGFPFLRQYGPPNALIAPWWGDLSVCPNFGQVGWVLTLDDNGQPMAIIQWSNVTASKVEHPTVGSCTPLGDWSACTDANLDPFEPGGTLPQFSFQVRLHSNSDVDFIYGPASNLNPDGDCFSQAVGGCGYISGIQSNLVFPNNVRPPLLDYTTQAISTCSGLTGCTQPQFPSGTSVTFHDVFRSIAPDLEVVSIAPAAQVPQGGSIAVPTVLSNGGGTDTSGEGQLQFYFSAGGTTPSGTPFSLQSVPLYHACSTAPYLAQVTLPASLQQGGGYLIAEFIPGAESVDQTHSLAYAPIVIGPQQVDVAAVGALTFAPAAVVGGQPITFAFKAQDLGGVDAPSVSYGIYLALGGSLSPTDTEICSGVITDLPPNGSPQTITGTCSLPSQLVSGDYLVGVILNPTNSLADSNPANNDAVGSKLLAFTSLGPSIVTAGLHDAMTNAPYSVQIAAAGGDGHYAWSLAAGALPAGLALTKHGVIQGQAENTGTSQFQVKVSDGENHSATATFQLTVDPFGQPLSIETPALPAGSAGQLYNFTVAALGGVPPYLWALAPGSGSLPAGISLLGTGTLDGSPTYDGNSSFQVTVTDSAGTSLTSPVYTLTVYAAGTLAVGSTILLPATSNQNYATTLRYAGGVGPYSWNLIDVYREPAAPGDTGSDLGSNLPPGLSWFPQAGAITGTPLAVGIYAITVQVIDAETPPQTALGLVLLTITSSTGFSFRTARLPAANVNEPYSVRLSTNADPSLNVTYELLDTSQSQATTANAALPAALTLYPNGQISGVPLASGSFPFLAEASDGAGGLATQSFVIDVEPAATAKSGGCQSGAGAPAYIGLLLLALTQSRRRTRRRR